MVLADLPQGIRENYEVHEWKHAVAILRNDFPAELADIVAVLDEFRLYRSEIMMPGGGKSLIASRLDRGLYERGWVKKSFRTQTTVDDDVLDSATHEVDCYRNRIALAVEWNNKDPFFGRDLNNFRQLFDLRAISIGVIITRSDELQAIFDSLGLDARGKPIRLKYGMSTTHSRSCSRGSRPAALGVAQCSCSALRVICMWRT